LLLLNPGVITKADTVEEQYYGYWLQILKNESEVHRLQHGYYVTCLSSKDGEGYDHGRIREKERAFFSAPHPMWSNLPSRSRLGSEKLTEALSRRLHKMIVAR